MKYHIHQQQQKSQIITKEPIDLSINTYTILVSSRCSKGLFTSNSHFASHSDSQKQKITAIYYYYIILLKELCNDNYLPS